MELKPPSSKLKLIIFFLLPSLFLVVILTLALREFVREKIVLPLAYFWSLLLLLFSSTPQVVFWGIFILISIFIIIKTLLAGKDKVVVPIAPKEDSLAPGRDHIYHWTIQVQLAVHGNLYFRDRVMRSLERLVMGVIAYQERLTFKEVEYALAHRSLEVPADIVRLFDYQPEIVSSPVDGKFVQLMRIWYGRIKAVFRRIILKKEPPYEYQKLEEIIDYLETQLEIKHGG